MEKLTDEGLNQLISIFEIADDFYLEKILACLLELKQLRAEKKGMQEQRKEGVA